MGVFDSKTFNSEVFGKYLETVPRVKQNEFIKNGILRTRGELATMLDDQAGGNYITVPMAGRIGGEPLNYDGSTDITASGIGTYTQSMIVTGRAKAWKEKDFSFDIAGHNFMEDIAAQVGEYWDDVDQATVLAILTGLFATADSANGNFASKHTLDLTEDEGGTVGASTLNNAIQQALGANKSIITMAIMHSQVATNLENLELLEYRKYTDSEGIRRDLAIADWNGRTVIIDDDVPVEEVAASGDKSGYDKYTTYLLGQGAFDYCDCGAKVPNETDRDPATNGGEEVLYTRQRKLFAPYGFSFVQPSTAIISPTGAQLKTGARWNIVKDAAGTGLFPHKAIPIVRIVSKG